MACNILKSTQPLQQQPGQIRWVSQLGYGLSCRKRCFPSSKPAVPITGSRGRKGNGWRIVQYLIKGMVMNTEEKYPRDPCTNSPSVPQDNWKHRSTRMKCNSCMYFVLKPCANCDGQIGRCRRHAPTMSGWPVMFGTDWCGDHKMDETKI